MKPIRAKNPAGRLAVMTLAWLVVAGCCRRASQQPPDSGVTQPSAKQADGQASRPDAPATQEPASPTIATGSGKKAAGNADTPLSEKQPPSKTASTPDDAADEEAKPRDLGPPLVDNPQNLVLLNPTSRAWVDAVGRRVVMVGEVCQRAAPLEMFACEKNTKEHESVVCVQTKASDVHAALLRVGAEAGHPVRFQPKYVPATGTEIEITVRWKDAQGKIQTARAQDWVRDYDTKKALDQPWVFAGSGFWTDEHTGQRYYLAEGGDFICVSNFPSAMLDLPIPSTDKDDSLLFEAFTQHIPPLGTPVTLILTPKKPSNQATSHDPPGTRDR